MVRPRRTARKLGRRHKRNPVEGEPVRLVRRCEGPLDAAPRKPLEHKLVIVNVFVVIKIDEAMQKFGGVAGLAQVGQPDRRNSRQQRDDVGLAIAAGLFQNAADLRADRVRRYAVVQGDVVNGFA